MQLAAAETGEAADEGQVLRPVILSPGEIELGPRLWIDADVGIWRALAAIDHALLAAPLLRLGQRQEAGMVAAEARPQGRRNP